MPRKQRFVYLWVKQGVSVGYRVKSKQGTNFRIWANRILKQFLLGNYVPKDRGAREKVEPFEALKNAVALINNVAQAQSLSGDQATGLLRVLTDYTYALDVLDKYDHQVLEVEATSPAQLFQITYGSAMEAITGWWKRASNATGSQMAWPKRITDADVTATPMNE